MARRKMMKKKRKNTLVHKTSPRSGMDMMRLKKNIWPQERDIMERPDRMKYVRKLIKSDGCVFCEAKAGGVHAESLCLFKSKHAMVVLNKYPYNTGHIMVLPVRHCADMTELSAGEYSEVSGLLKTAIEIVKKEYDVAGMNIGLNMGAVAGAGIPDHMHWHVVPRWLGDTNFFPLIAETKAIPETLMQTYERYRKHFKILESKHDT